MTNNLLTKNQEEIKITPEPFGAMVSNLNNMLFRQRAFIWDTVESVFEGQFGTG